MNYIFAGMILIGVVIGALSGRTPDVSTAALNDSYRAVELMLVLLGNMCLWSGLMKLAEASGLTRVLSKLFSPLTNLLFRGLRRDGPAMGLITMNMTANLLGLGNAATPLGIAALQAMEKEQRTTTVATDDMCMFVTLNTASMQIIPTTTAMIRASAGSAAPMEILPAVWLSSIVSVVSGILAVRILSRFWRRRRS